MPRRWVRRSGWAVVLGLLFLEEGEKLVRKGVQGGWFWLGLGACLGGFAVWVWLWRPGTEK